MKVQIIIGSTRPGRIGTQVAEWVELNLPKVEGVDYEVVDIKEWDLPMFDEPMHPSAHDYKFDHTKAWSEKISQASGYVFVTPEYNKGYPASLKNAIDYLAQEWTDKPVILAGYGFHGAKSATSQLDAVAKQLKMVPTETTPAIFIKPDYFNESYQLKDLDTNFADYAKEVKKAGEELIELLNKAS